MSKKLFEKFNSLPFTHIEDNAIRHRLTDRKISTCVVDILDGDLWGSKVSLIGNLFIILAILLSSGDFVFNSGMSAVEPSFILNLTRWIIAVFFFVEISLRVYYASFLGYGDGKLRPSLNYIFSFIGLIDFLSLLPMLIEMMGFPVSGGLSALRILRIWRIARFIKAFNSISQAFKSRREEILVTLLAVLLLSLTLSAVMFHFETESGKSNFQNITQVFIWSIGKYTGDYGAIAGEVPITQIGKFIATINGLLGIALFAIPAGLLASAFIDQLAENRQQKIIQERIGLITRFFKKSKGGSKHLKYPGLWRYASFETIQAKLLLSDEELFEAVRESGELRFRAMKSVPGLKYNDMRIIEYFSQNASYGTKLEYPGSKMTLINPVGEIERGISHFVFTLATNLKTRLLSRECEIKSDDKRIGQNKSVFYTDEYLRNLIHLPVAFQQFISDLSKAEKEEVTVIISSAASGRSDLVWEYGNPKENKVWTEGLTTIRNEERLQTIREILQSECANVYYRTSSEKDFTKSFSIEENTIGMNQDDSLSRRVWENYL